MNLDHFAQWMQRSVTSEERVSEVLTARLGALLDQPPSAPSWNEGKEIPPGWHLPMFGQDAPQSALMPDGHGPKGSLIPPIEWPYRMFAGRRMQVVNALCVGDVVRRVSQVTDIREKKTRSGPMCLVTLRHELHVRDRLCVTEEQDIIYRPSKLTLADDAAVADPPPAECLHQRSFVPTASHLFRFSALTNNAHRIHYDEGYARGVEGFPGLVVNGSLPVLFLWQFAAERLGRPLRSSSMRNVRPMFVDRPLTLCLAAEQEGRTAAWVRNAEGAMVVKGELGWG